VNFNRVAVHGKVWRGEGPVMAKAFQMAALIAAAWSLSACGTSGGSGSAPVSQGPKTTVTGTTAVQVYSHLARQVRTCWFNPSAPVLTKHVFRGEAAANTTGAKVTKIAIYDQAPDRKRGLKAFTIDIQPERNGAQIIAQNQRLPYALGQKLVADVGYWAQGGVNCDGPAQASNAVSRGSVAGPRVTQ